MFLSSRSLSSGSLCGLCTVLLLIARDVRAEAEAKEPLPGRASLEIALSPLSRASAERWQLPQTMQAQVTFVVPGGGGERMGLRAGDVLVRLNGREVASVSQTVRALRELKAGERLDLEVLRNGERVKLAGRYETHLDEPEVERRYRRAAEQGDAAAQNALGLKYANGAGVLKDQAEAVQWYRKAAEQGNADAQAYLGWMYQGGCGVTKDEAEAVKWYRKAAEQGHAIAQYNLGCLHQYGSAEKNLTEARKWYSSAAAQKHEDAKKALERLGSL